MGRFYPLYVRRSDGKKEVIYQRKREMNQPSEEQLDQRPDKNGISDYYRELAPDEPKHLDWRRKIGGMLARALHSDQHAGGGMNNNSENGYILAAFPENYRLYEHVKKTVTVVDGKTEVKGGNDRQDAYLYGHPLGRRKRFRSPGDFFAHVLWLSTDESGDPDNCTCKICSPEDLENMISQGLSVKVKVKGKVQVQVDPATVVTPTPLPPKKWQEQDHNQEQEQDRFCDSQYRSFMYRPGELVWFQRGQAWALGAIVRRWGQLPSPEAADRHYLVQPLSRPPLASTPTWRYPQQIIKSDEGEMRPWIAWSVPRFTHEALNNLSPPAHYSTIDWQAVHDHRFGHGDVQVDASILAAKMVDSTYTPIAPSRQTNPSPGLTETHYEAIFLGAEKIWRGEPIRLYVGNGIDIMVVHDILERTTSTSSEPVLQFLGDIYTLTPHQHSNAALPTPASPHANTHLPSRLTSDLAYRNARSIPLKHIAHYWKLISPQQRIGINDVKGRWYEASLILPILQPQAFADAERKGDIQEASLCMNSRGDCEGVRGKPSLKRTNIRTQTRKAAFMGSVPGDVEFTDGLLPLGGGGEVKEDLDEELVIDPRFDTADGNGNETENENGDEAKGGTSFDDLMNFEGEDGTLGFGGQGHSASSFF